MNSANEALMVGVNQLESLNQEKTILFLKNKELSDNLELEKKKTEDEESRRYLETKSLKEELNEKTNFIERLQI